MLCNRQQHNAIACTQEPQVLRNHITVIMMKIMKFTTALSVNMITTIDGRRLATIS